MAKSSYLEGVDGADGLLRSQLGAWNKKRKDPSTPPSKDAVKSLLKKTDRSIIDEAVRYSTESALACLLDALMRQVMPTFYTFTDFVVLHTTIRFGYLDHVNFLLRGGADPNVRDEVGNTPLHLLARRVHIQYLASSQQDALQSLLRAGANVNAQNDLGETPLHILAVHVPASLGVSDGREQFLETFVKHKVNINAKDNEGKNPIHRLLNCTLCKAPEVVRRFLKTMFQNGAEANAADATGSTALHHLAQHGFSNGTDVQGNADNIRLLLSYGADLTAKDKYGKQPAWYAAAKFQIPEIDHPQSGDAYSYKLVNFLCLLGRGVDVEAEVIPGRPLLHMLLGYPRAISKLLDIGADVNARDDRGNTILHKACSDARNLDRAKYEWFDINVRQLFEFGANPNLQNRDGDTPLHLFGKIERMAPYQRNLLGDFAVAPLPINLALTNGRGRTVLGDAMSPDISLHSRRLICHLLEHGADINTLNSQGDTALHILARPLQHPGYDSHWTRQQEVDVFNNLINNRDIPILKNHKGKTVLQTAAETALGGDRGIDIIRLIRLEMRSWPIASDESGPICPREYWHTHVESLMLALIGPGGDEAARIVHTREMARMADLRTAWAQEGMIPGDGRLVRGRVGSSRTNGIDNVVYALRPHQRTESLDDDNVSIGESTIVGDGD